MRRWETLTALAAVIFATLGSIKTSYQYALAAVAVVLISLVGFSRLITAFGTVKKPDGFDPAEQAKRIREQRHRH